MDSYSYCPSSVYDPSGVGAILWWAGKKSEYFVCSYAVLCYLLHRVCYLGHLRL